MTRPQFTLRSLLVIMLVVAAVVAIIAHRARTQREVVAALLRKGAVVIYHHQESGQWGWEEGEPNAPRWLRQLIGDDYFQTVKDVYLRGRHVSDNDLAALAKLRGLDSVFLLDTSTTAAGLAAFRKHNPYCDIDHCSIPRPP